MDQPATVIMDTTAAEQFLDLVRQLNGITTYPKADDDNNRVLHGGCLELERQGKLCRRTNDEHVVLWGIPE